MTTRPAISPLFATDATLGTGPESALAPRLDPGAGVRARGFLANTRAPARWFNFLNGLAGDWIDYLDQKTKHVFNILNYGADPTGAVDATSAIQAAIAAAFAAGGGDVFVPPGIYKRSILTLRSGVNLRGIANSSILRFTGGGATNGLVCIDNLQGPACEVSDLQFDADAANTGTSVVNNSGRRVVFRNCTWNEASANLQGEIALVNNAASELAFIDCTLKVAADVNGLHVQSGLIEMSRGRLVMPATYNQNLFRVEGSARGRMLGVDVDCRARSAGGGVAALLADAASTIEQSHCRIDGTAASGTIYGCLWSAGARVATRANDWLGNITPYGGNMAQLGSSIELLPMSHAFTTGSAFTLANGYMSVRLESQDTGGTDVTLPAGLFPGQVLHFTYFNNTVGSVSWVFTGVLVTGTTVPTIGAGNTLTGTFVWEDRGTGGYRWIQVGTWGVGLTLV